MKPMKVIREQMENALQEYSNVTLCEIMKVVRTKGSHTYAVAVPMGQLPNGDGPGAAVGTLNIPIINRPPGWIENNIAEKYYIVALSMRNNKPSLSLGFLVYKSLIDTFETWTEEAKRELDPFALENIVEAKGS